MQKKECSTNSRLFYENESPLVNNGSTTATGRCQDWKKITACQPLIPSKGKQQ